MLIADIIEEPEPGLPHAGALISALGSDNPLAVIKAVRDLRFIIDNVEFATLPRLKAMPGMTEKRIANLTGHGQGWVRQRLSLSSSSSSSTMPPSPSASDGPL